MSTNMVANTNGKDISSIISTTNERFKLTLNKADWPLKKKKDLLVQANSLRIIEHLEGTAEAPGEPPNNNLSTKRYYDEKENVPRYSYTLAYLCTLYYLVYITSAVFIMSATYTFSIVNKHN